jgi:hypothetical protein
VCWLAAELWLESNVIAPLVPSVALAWFGVGLGVGALAFAGAGALTSLRQRGRGLGLVLAAAPPLAAFLLLWAATNQDWPIHARFGGSHSALNELADRVAAGERPGDTRAGWFTVRESQAANTCVLLMTANDGDRTGGFARCAFGAKPGPADGYTFAHLSGDWWTWRTAN